MRLTRKLVLSLLVGFLAVLLAGAGLGVRREAALLDSDVRRDHLLLGRALGRDLAPVLDEHGPDKARERALRTVAPGDHVRIDWLALETDGVSAMLDARDRDVLRAGHEILRRTAGQGGEPDSLYTFVPVPGHTGFALQITESLREEQRYLEQTIVQVTAITVILLLVTAVVTALVGRHFVTRPIRLILDKINRVAAGELDGEVCLRQRDELGTIAEALNEMSRAITRGQHRLQREMQARVDAVEQLRHADRLTTVGRLASGVAHELGTPLSVIGGRAEMLLLGSSASEEARQLARIAREQTQRMTQIVRQLLDFARKHSPQKTDVELAALIRQTLLLLAPAAAKVGVDLRLDGSVGQVTVLADESQLQQVLMNLVSNAIQATPPGGSVSLAASIAAAPPPPPLEGAVISGDLAVMTVADTGSGMAADVVARIFEPFFTTKDVGEGTGLGLSVAHGIVREHGGWITVDSTPGKGSVFSVYLPRGGGT